MDTLEYIRAKQLYQLAMRVREGLVDRWEYLKAVERIEEEYRVKTAGEWAVQAARDRARLMRGGNEVVFFPSVWGGPPNRNKHIFSRGAFDLGRFSRDPVVLVDHKGDPIAKAIDVEENNHGLLATARFCKGRAAREWRTILRERLERGKGNYCSIGLEGVTTRPVAWADGEPAKIVTRADVGEMTLLGGKFENRPADPRAQVLWVT